ncbi:MAG: glycogen/starch/alpha-glucan phosphorylase, partial [Thiohalomonadales bacterium]
TPRLIEDDRTTLSENGLKQAMIDNLFYIQGKYDAIATDNDKYMAVAYTIRDRLIHRWISTVETYSCEKDIRVVCYLSAEFLLGPHLGNNLINLGITEKIRKVLSELGIDFDELLAQEEEPGLGNGGLGRLAACYLDSLASLEIPAIGYGIRYEFGIFDQKIQNGWQAEITDKWLKLGNPWEIERPEAAVEVKFGGYTETYEDQQGRYCVRWVADRVVKGVPCDTPILGYKVNTCNNLRLWKAEAAESFNFESFNKGDYSGAVYAKVASENITKILYPNDETDAGKRLRLEQQYFFVSCSLQDMLRLHLRLNNSLEIFHEKFSVQLNDTHPSVGVPELMRLLMDVHNVGWDKAWAITQKTFAYTNHTLLPEALEKWSLGLFQSLLPRHLEIIYEINNRFLDEVRLAFPGDLDRLSRMSIIDETNGKYVRMAHLACVGSYAINGVAAMHTELLKNNVLHDFHSLWPNKISNKTNGVTPRRWMALSNPKLTALISQHLGDSWIKNLEQELKKLEAHVDDSQFCAEWRKIKHENKLELATIIKRKTGIEVNPHSLFDIQVKRIHEYKRQHLNVLYIISQYLRIKNDPNVDIVPRTFIFGGKAAPSYFMAKLVIKLITSVAEIVNNDPVVNGRLKVIFFPNFNVKNAHNVYPAADLSEQISTAGKEASGTGNMKFSLNGALTIGTLDGANVEMREEVGEENFFLFGLTEQKVNQLKSNGYDPRQYYQNNNTLKQVLDLIQSGFFSRGDTQLFKPLLDSLLNHDEYMLLADFQSYIDCQEKVSECYMNQDEWTRKSILNVARMGKFSSDRSIRDYCEDIWKIKPVSVCLKKT